MVERTWQKIVEITGDNGGSKRELSLCFVATMPASQYLDNMFYLKLCIHTVYSCFVSYMSNNLNCYNIYKKYVFVY